MYARGAAALEQTAGAARGSRRAGERARRGSCAAHAKRTAWAGMVQAHPCWGLQLSAAALPESIKFKPPASQRHPSFAKHNRLQPQKELLEALMGTAGTRADARGRAAVLAVIAFEFAAIEFLRGASRLKSASAAASQSRRVALEARLRRCVRAGAEPVIDLRPRPASCSRNQAWIRRASGGRQIARSAAAESKPRGGRGQLSCPRGLGRRVLAIEQTQPCRSDMPMLAPHHVEPAPFVHSKIHGADRGGLKCGS
eukprot:272854-Chlamydomonas_euryale.AAC.5